ncbi:thioesterase II family protein [Streptomyces sp. NPDC088732]|uniref:thioesterase II family protein n=1 Tax=Streptomyces sp. NPDC088732 TaxID=3365879 RepID=UPI00382A524B
MDNDLWIRRFQPATPGSVPLVCFPFAGGSAGYFRPLPALLGPGVDVLAVQYPGRQDRRNEPVVDDIPRLAELICDALAPMADRPYAFFGHSMGALVAFEVVRCLALRGRREPAVLFVSGRRAPSVVRDDRVHLKSDADLVTELRSLGGTDAAILADDELVQMILPAVRGDYRAVETYRAPVPQAVLDVPIAALIGDQDPRVSVEEVSGWRDHTSAGFSLKIFPGGHFYLGEAAADVAAEITATLSAHV